MPDTKINGSKTKPIPAAVRAGMAKGLPKATAQAKAGLPKSTVRV